MNSAHYMLSITPQGVVVHRLNEAVERNGFVTDRNWTQVGDALSHLGDAMQVVRDCEAGLLEPGELNTEPLGAA